MNRHDVLVGHGGGCLGLAGEALTGCAAGRILARQHLDRDRAVQGRVERPQHDAHAAPAQDLEHLIGPQPAERARPVRRLQKVQVGAQCRRRPVETGSLPRLRGPVTAQVLPDLVPPARATRHFIEPIPAGRAHEQVRFEVLP